MRFSRSFAFRSLFCVFGAALLGTIGARADQVRHPTAIFAGLDKITGRIISFDVAIDETVQFGTLQITPRICLTRPQTEAPLTEGFIEVDEIDAAKAAKRIFSGWMFAASPGLHGVEHPVYDVWLKDCKGGVEVTASPANAQPNPNAPPPANAAPAGAAVKKPRRTIEPQEPVEPTMDSLPPTNSDAPPPSADAPANENGSPDGLGAPIEVGPPPGAPRTRAPANGQSAPAASDQGFDPGDAPPPPAPKPPKPKRKPPVDPNAAPPAGGAAAPAAPSSAPAPQQRPSGPQELLEKIPFFR